MIVGQGKAITVTIVTLVGTVLIAIMVVLSVLTRDVARDIANSGAAPAPGTGNVRTISQAIARLRENDPASWITPDDYPAEALRRGEQGSVRFRAEIGPNGRVSRCSIVESSGSPSLDGATCRAVSKQARIDRGDTTVPLVITHRVVWRLPE